MLYIPISIQSQMQQAVQAGLPNETCGLLAGSAGVVSMCFEIPNELHSPNRFRMAPQQQWLAFQEIERLDLELIAIYHSHPKGPVHPSPLDIQEFAYPGVYYLIWSPHQKSWICHAYQILEQRYELVEIYQP